MAASASCHQVSARVDWMWKSNEDPWSNIETEEWTPYTDIESIMIEEAFQNKAQEVVLDNYHIDLKNFVQISNSNMQLQRPVKRIPHNQGKKAMMRRARFLPEAIEPKKTFEQWRDGVSHFVFAVRNDLNLDPYFSLDDIPSCRFLVEKAAEGLLIEGKLAGQQKKAEWMAKKLLEVKDGPSEEVIKTCAQLYSMESFLFQKMNEVMRFEGDKDKFDVWCAKIRTFGPFAFLLQEAVETGSENKTTVYRGATLSEELIEQYRQADPMDYLMFPAFTSTSRDPEVANVFGGNALFIIEIKPHDDAIDISAHSNMPDEEELLLHAYFEFQVVSCTFDENKKKWLIHLKSFNVK